MSTDRRAETDDLREELRRRVLDLCRELVPEGHVDGKYWICKNPTRADRHAGSMWVWLRDKPGAWCDSATGDKGDILGLINYALRHPSMRETFAWARQWLGAPDRVRLVRRARPPEDDAARETAIADVLARNRRRALGVWLAARPGLVGTPAETYFRSRGIDIRGLVREPRALRLAAAHDHVDKDGVVTTWPCLMAGMYGPDGALSAVHRTWLAADGSGKAPVSPARKIWPSFQGAVIPLARGASGLPPKLAGERGVKGPLALVEGVEDGLALALACPELRVWAVGALANFAAVTIPACASEVIVCADNDWGKPQAARLLDKALAALMAQGAEVSVARAAVGKDVNEALRGRVG